MLLLLDWRPSKEGRTEQRERERETGGGGLIRGRFQVEEGEEEEEDRHSLVCLFVPLLSLSQCYAVCVLNVLRPPSSVDVVVGSRFLPSTVSLSLTCVWQRERGRLWWWQ